MNEKNVKFVGVDVAKDHLELYCPGLKLPTRLNNNSKTIAAWLRRLLVSSPAIHVVCESTGGCENALMRACWQAKVPVSQLNPTWVRAFAPQQGPFGQDRCHRCTGLGRLRLGLHAQSHPRA